MVKVKGALREALSKTENLTRSANYLAVAELYGDIKKLRDKKVKWNNIVSILAQGGFEINVNTLRSLYGEQSRKTKQSK